jgi:putative RNA 2'-phosphotransferase
MNNQKQLDRISRFLSTHLRHDPKSIGIELDKEGWTNIDVLIAQASLHGKVFDRAFLQEVVDTNAKKRFAISEDGTRIRALQGHSTDEVDIAYEQMEPPGTLYHGTSRDFIDKIINEGLKPGERHYVHLTASVETAVKRAQTQGKPVLLEIPALEMHRQGFVFHLSENGVWLIKHVPAEFLHVTTGRKQAIDTNYFNQIYQVPAEKKDAK